MMGETVGRAIGALLAPVAAMGSRLRRSRVLHPDGVVYVGRMRATAQDEPWLSLAARLSGQALVRFSGALWRHGREWPEILGCAVRLREDAATAEEEPHDQDLLFATARSAARLPGAMISTNQHDFLRNDYYAIGQFHTAETGLVQLRLVPEPGGQMGGPRQERLDDRVQRGLATLHLEARGKVRGAPWVRVADLELTERAQIDQSRLRFSPLHAGRGIEPRGMLQAMRVAPYRASHRGRGDL